MREAFKLGLTLAAGAIVLAGCATMGDARHKYLMRGQVLEAHNGEVYLCIGTADGAKPGQQLVAYRFERGKLPSSKSSRPTFRKEKTGTVQITEIVDEHYARAKVISGEVDQGSMVELK